jgi:rRNA-processing protein FCF1
VPKPTQKEPLRVIFDSNALFAPFQFKIDVFGELERLLGRRFELVLLSAVKQELELLAEQGSPKLRRDASYALGFAERLRLVEVEAGAADDVIVAVAKQWGAVVFTNDKALRQRLRDISVPVIYVRQKSRLEIDGIV